MKDILHNLQSVWWVFLLRGIAAVIFGIMAFAWPALTLSVLILLIGAYVLVDGVFGVIDVMRNRDRLKRVWPLVLEAVLGIVVGLMMLFWPGATAIVMLMFVAAWAIVGGLLRVVLAFQIRKEITGEWILIVGGIMSILFGGLLVAMPQVGMLTMAWMIGFYAILFGGLFIFLAFRLRKLGSSSDTHA